MLDIVREKPIFLVLLYSLIGYKLWISCWIKRISAFYTLVSLSFLPSLCLLILPLLFPSCLSNVFLSFIHFFLSFLPFFLPFFWCKNFLENIYVCWSILSCWSEGYEPEYRAENVKLILLNEAPIFLYFF